MTTNERQPVWLSGGQILRFTVVWVSEDVDAPTMVQLRSEAGEDGDAWIEYRQKNAASVY